MVIDMDTDIDIYYKELTYLIMEPEKFKMGHW